MTDAYPIDMARGKTDDDSTESDVEAPPGKTMSDDKFRRVYHEEKERWAELSERLK